MKQADKDSPKAEKQGGWPRRLAALWPDGEGLKLAVPALFMVIVAFIAAHQFVKPAPPDQLIILAGPQSGTYFQIAQRYQTALAAHGIAAEIVETSGSVDNLNRLHQNEKEAMIAFSQAGISLQRPMASDNGGGNGPNEIEALASLYYEPAWLFLRDDVQITDFRDLTALRIAKGPLGSGSRALAETLYALNDLPFETGAEQKAPDQLSGDDALAALVLGQIDGVFTVGSAHSPSIKALIAQPGISLFSLPRSHAYARRLPYIDALELPQGTLDLARNIPQHNTALIATTAMLVTTADLHPALIDLLLMTAQSVHDQAGLFEDAGQFPSAHKLSLPLNDEAARFHRRGPSFLQRVLPFWAATLLDRWLVMALPLLTLLIPLLRIFPPLYGWRIRAKISRPYRLLHEIERACSDPTPKQSPGKAAAMDCHDALKRLSALDKSVEHLRVPATYQADLHALKFHIQRVRENMAKTQKNDSDEPPLSG
ncbi:MULTISPECIES: TAXI family TRAP transporter solute-binding subunit [unclassified Iodidimonas]|jgi:TRAP transporter TAXI family solute receptor|uniref:TAXI family TRAP transporter solute-binding subunit n=1 Tax=unclassified Iodidimonas TaxID=2626145 RepID=UPI002482BF09|nr:MULTISPECIES: TAXI family TRAP transporter solute-binding subunit [unclassified Iodidimonas]